MPKTFPFDTGKSDLQAVRFYQIDRRDGVTVRLNDADHDVVVDPLGAAITYLALPNVSFSELNYSDDGRSNLCEIVAILQAGGPFDPADIAIGKFASANVTVWIGDLSDLSAVGFAFRGLIADQTYSEDQTAIKFEVRSDLALAKVVPIEVYSSLCRANFGDYKNPTNQGRCKLPVKPDDRLNSHNYPVGAFMRVRSGIAGNPLDYANRYYEVTATSGAGMTAASQPTYDTVVGHTTIDGDLTLTAREAWLRTVTIVSVTAPFTFTISDPLDARVVDGWFALGWIAINGNYLIGYDVRSYVAATTTVKLWMPVATLLHVGDVIDISPGCDRRRKETCGPRFGNAGNNRSES